MSLGDARQHLYEPFVKPRLKRKKWRASFSLVSVFTVNDQRELRVEKSHQTKCIHSFSSQSSTDHMQSGKLLISTLTGLQVIF